jgi:hypothetical protein
MDSISTDMTVSDEKTYPKFQDYLYNILFPLGDSSYYFEQIQFPLMVNGTEISREEWKPFYQLTQNEYFNRIYSDTAGIYNIPDPTGISETFVLNYTGNKILKFEFKPYKESWRMTSIITDYKGSLPDSEFMEFLIKFSTDSIFQKQRIKYPFQDCTFFPGEEPNTTLIQSGNWNYTSLFKEEVLYSTHLIDENSKFRIFNSAGIGCGIAVVHVFEKIAGKWYLTKSENYSS